MKVYINEEKRRPVDVDVEIIKGGRKFFTRGRYFDENDPSFHGWAVVHTKIVSPHCGMTHMSSC